MIKGINRNIIVVKMGRNSCFEAVFFVPKKGGTDKRDILCEANRIIADSDARNGKKPRGRWILPRLTWLLSGFLLGAGGAAIVCVCLLM